MDLNRPPSEIANAAAEEMRALNHRTLKPDSFENAPDLARSADGIAAVIQRLPQALQQLEVGLQALHDESQIRLADRHPSEVSAADISRAVFDALFDLREAREALGRVEEHIQSSTRVLRNLGAPWPDEEA